MANDPKSKFPGTLGEHKDAIKAEAKNVSAKIEEAFQKLATKMVDRANKAKAKMDSTKKAEKRAILLRRFELYSDAATHLKEHLPRSKN